jgi:hypothetical protein
MTIHVWSDVPDAMFVKAHAASNCISALIGRKIINNLTTIFISTPLFNQRICQWQETVNLHILF